MQSTPGLPALILTGASGLLGKYLLDDLKNDFRIFAIARRSQHECNAPRHSNIAWMRADISDLNSITKTFREIKTAGGAEYLIHLAAYYDFENEYHPEYKRTNIDGTKNILTLAKELNLKLFVFASSVAACSFPSESHYINENSPADGSHIYAQSKKAGEEMVKKFAEHTPSCIMRLGAIFSDWCEYAPLYMQINTWVGGSWKAKVIAGHGDSSIPYIHVRDVINFFRNLFRNYNKLKPGEILIASTDGSTSHLQLYKLTTRYYFGNEHSPVLLPKIICAFGVYLINSLKLLFRMKSFEKPWMIKYIDKRLNVKSIITQEKINWSPDLRLHIEKRLPFMIERLKSEPIQWQMRNSMILRKTEARIDFIIYTVLIEDEEVIIDNLLETINIKKPVSVSTRIDNQDLKWFIKLIYRLILTSINTNSKLLVQNYFEVSSISKFESGYDLESIIFLLKKIEEGIINHLSRDKRTAGYRKELYDYISLPIEFAIDEAEQQNHIFVNKIKTSDLGVVKETSLETASARELLEETIWNCLVNRK